MRTVSKGCSPSPLKRYFVKPSREGSSVGVAVISVILTAHLNASDLAKPAMAATLGPTVKRVYAVDTFVSSDSPLESWLTLLFGPGD